MFALFHGCHGCSKSVQSSIARKMFVSRFQAFDFPQYLRFSPAFRLAHLPIDRQFAFRIDFWYARRLNFKIFNELVILRSHSFILSVFRKFGLRLLGSFVCNYDLTVYFSFLFFLYCHVERVNVALTSFLFFLRGRMELFETRVHDTSSITDVREYINVLLLFCDQQLLLPKPLDDSGTGFQSRFN